MSTIKKILAVAALSSIFATTLPAADRIVTCTGIVSYGGSIFRTINGQLRKLHVDGKIGDCLFSTIGKYSEVNTQIAKVCPPNDPAECRVLAVVGEVAGSLVIALGPVTDRVENPKLYPLVDGWIKKILKIESL